MALVVGYLLQVEGITGIVVVRSAYASSPESTTSSWSFTWGPLCSAFGIRAIFEDSMASAAASACEKLTSARLQGCSEPEKEDPVPPKMPLECLFFFGGGGGVIEPPPPKLSILFLVFWVGSCSNLRSICGCVFSGLPEFGKPRSLE